MMIRLDIASILEEYLIFQCSRKREMGKITLDYYRANRNKSLDNVILHAITSVLD